MSVPTWKRSLSPTDFLYQPYRLCIRLTEIMANKPKKYRANMSDQILTTALDALKYLQTANSIFFTKTSSEADYLTRRRLLQTSKGYIENVSTVFYIFIETVRKHDSENDDRLYKQEMEVGDACNTIIKRIDGILKSDKEIYKKYIRGPAS